MGVLDFLFGGGCGLVLLACNTASAEALRALQQDWLPKRYPGKNVLGVIRPLAEAAAEVTKKKVVGVLATRSTANSHAYRRELGKIDKKIMVIEQPCRLLVPLIEEGFESKTELRMILKRYVRPLKDYHVDTIILGCTHYGFIEKDIRRYAGKNVSVLDSGTVIAEKFADYLLRHPEYESMLSRNGARTFLTTETTEAVTPLANKFLGRRVTIEQVSL